MSQARRERFNRARHLATVLDPAQLELDAYNAATDLAITEEWHKSFYTKGREVIRHAGRIALAQHIAAELWTACTYCQASPNTCGHCGGTGCTLITESALAELIEIPLETVIAIWRPRIDAISRVIGTWYDAGQG